jgi:hypothetical protein
MSIDIAARSITEVRQNLFKLADEVLETGEPLLIERNGKRLKLVRDESPAERPIGRLARLKKQPSTIGPPLDPHESPAQWNPFFPVIEQRVDQVAAPRAKYRP